jgi:hypothetical protein
MQKRRVMDKSRRIVGGGKYLVGVFFFWGGGVFNPKCRPLENCLTEKLLSKISYDYLFHRGSNC